MSVSNISAYSSGGLPSASALVNYETDVNFTGDSEDLRIFRSDFTGQSGYYSGSTTLTYKFTVGDRVLLSGTVTRSVGPSSYSVDVLDETERLFTFQRGHEMQTLTGLLEVSYTGFDSNGKRVTNSASKTKRFYISSKYSYTVTFDANGGTNPPAAQTKWYNETLTLTYTVPTRTDYVFKEWNTAADGTGTSYAAGGSFTANANTTLYAIWYAPYSVTYDANGGTGAPSAQVKVHGQALTLSSAIPTRGAYEFKRWNTNTSDSGTAYQPSALYEGNANLALHAIWNPIISFDANGGTGAPWPQTKTYGTTLRLTTDVPTRDGHDFYRWNTKADGTGTSYAPGANYTSNSAATLYAIWRRRPTAPAITSMSVVRCTSSGTPDDSGTYCKVTVAWSVDTTSETVSGNTGTVTGTVEVDGSYSPRSFSWQSGASGTGGTAVAVVSGIDTDEQYLVTVTVTDLVTSTSRSDVCTRAFFIMDFAAGGEGVGIGSAAPQSGLEIGYATQFSRDVAMLGDLSVAGDVAVTGDLVAPNLTVVDASSSVVSAASGWSLVSQSAHTYGAVCMVCLTLRPTSTVSAGTSHTLGTLAASYRPRSSCGFADAHGVGLADAFGDLTYRAVAAVATTDTVTVGLTFIK